MTAPRECRPPEGTDGDLLGASGNRHSGKNRSWRDRLNAIPAMQQKVDEFKLRVIENAGDVLALADMMAEAIDMKRDANHLEVVARNGMKASSFEEMAAAWCMFDAQEAFRHARESNRPAHPCLPPQVGEGV